MVYKKCYFLLLRLRERREEETSFDEEREGRDDEPVGADTGSDAGSGKEAVRVVVQASQ